MAFTNWKTWSVGETLTAANFNQQIRDNGLADGPHLIARKTADQSVASSTAFVSDTHLQLTVAANEVWLMKFHLRYDATAVGDLKVSFSLPAGGTIDAAVGAGPSNTTGVYQDAQWQTLVTTDSQPLSFAGAGAGVVRTLTIEGTYIGAGTAGTVILRWAQNTSDPGATRTLTHSTLWGVKLA